MKYLLLLSIVGLAFAVPTPVTPDVPEGTCPVNHAFPSDICVADCQEDSHCAAGLKCCMTTNCGKKCLDPVVEPDEPVLLNMRTREEITDMLSTILEERSDLTEKLEKYPPPMLRFIAMRNRTNVVRMCVISPCELRKCQRIAQELTYNIEPRKEFFCHAATSTKQCLFWAERGWTDTVMARGHHILVAKRKFNVTAFAQETLTDDGIALIEKMSQNITLAVTKVTSAIGNLSQMQGSRVCSAGIRDMASFVSPVCTLIERDIIPHTGNVMESATDFFGDMCVPDALDKTTVNQNETLPEKLITGCNGNVEDYSGIRGSIRCAFSTNGVAFVDHKVVREMMVHEEYNAGFRLVCQDDTKPLASWIEKPCQVGYTPRPIMFLNPHRNDTYIQEFQTIITNAMKLNSGKPGSLNFFDSSEYNCGNQDTRNLILMEENDGFTFINESIAEQRIEVKNYFRTYDICESLSPKPIARFCAVGHEEHQNCLEMKRVFESNSRVKKVAWGCVMAKTNLDCMRNVLNGTAELYQADSKEIFIGGHDMQLQPIIMQDQVVRNTVDDYAKTFGTHSVAVMKKSKLWKDYGQDTKFIHLRNLTVCSGAMNKVESFHLPIGRMLSLDIFPRIGSVFESLNRNFKSACIAGANPNTYTHDWDLILGHELNWGIPGLNFYNFTGFNWFVWNSPHTWNFYNYNRKTPGTLKTFMQNRLIVPILEGKLSLPEGFDAKKFDYSILDDVLSVEGLGDILSDVPDRIRDRLAELRVSRKEKMTTFKDLFEDRTGEEFVRPKDKRLGRQTIRSYLQKSFDNMQDDWGVFENVDSPLMASRKPVKTLTGSQVSNIRRIVDDRADESDPNAIIGNLLQNYDSEYTVPLISKLFAKVLKQRYDTLMGLAESMNIIRGVPTMSNIRDEPYEWINHPAVQAFVRIYAPRLATYHSDLFDNSELQSYVHSRYLNPLWLTPTYPEFLDSMKEHMTGLTDTCQGYKEHKGSPGEEEPFSGLAGSIECIADGNAGDIAFVELERFVEEITKIGQTVSDYVVMAPMGIIKEITTDLLTDRDFLRNVTYGVNAYPAILTAFNNTGTWRWNITRALLTAQKIYSTDQNNPTPYTMFGQNSMFAAGTAKLVPIPLQDQTYATYLGPNLTRSFEAIIKPSTFDWWKERRHICNGHTYTNVIEQNEGTCKAIVKDVTCAGMPRPKVISVGTTQNKQPIVVKMCSRPTRFVREMAEFRCDNGHGYLTPVMVPTTCQCVPCDEVEYQPDWTKDPIWKTPAVKHTVTEHFESSMPLWGNADFWQNHTLNSNFEIGEMDEEVGETIQINRLIVKALDSCERRWYGYRWHPQWFPGTNRPVCLETITGLRRVLAHERLKSKVMT